MLKIGVIRGSTEKEVKSKIFNLYVGVSIGNKWFTDSNIKHQILWCLKYSKNKVAILIGDTLHAINYEVRNKLSPEKAYNRAIKEGDKYVKRIKKIISKLPREEQLRICIVRWDDVKKDSFNKEFIAFFYKEFKENKKFNQEVKKIVLGFTKNETKSLSEKEIDKLCEYILQELPELLHGFTYNGVYYNCYTYPFDNPLTQMVEKIQKKEIFSHFHDKLRVKKNVFIELR